VSTHLLYQLNADDEEWLNQKRLMDAVIGYLAGANDIIFHPGSYFGKPVEEAMPVHPSPFRV
jgi:deoxyribonuclease-4